MHTHNQKTKASIEVKSWPEIREKVIAVNAKLGEIIDEINPDSKKFKLYLLKYPFGSEILKRGMLYLPNKNGELVELNSPEISDSIKQDLGYNLGSNPVTLVLKNSVELFMQIEDRIISCYGLISAGKIFGLWRIHNLQYSHSPEFIWGMTAGARSLFMLPKISSAHAYKRLQNEFNVKFDPPQHIADHWEVFKKIEIATAQNAPWTSEVLFFSAEWFKYLDDPRWLHFSYYLLKNAWKNTEFWRNQFIWDMVFSIVYKRKNVAPNPHVNNTVRHIFAIGAGGLAGFSVAINNQAGPVQELQKIFSEMYDLEYAPIMMQPNLFSTYISELPVYYSLEYPTIILDIKKPKALANKITELDHIQHVFEKVKNEMLHGHLNIQCTPYHDFLNLSQVEFLHRTPSIQNNLKSTSEIPALDPSLLASVKEFTKKPFPKDSPFLCGCVVIKRNSEKH